MKTRIPLFALFLGMLFLGGLIRFHNLTEMLVDGRLYFVDADCYSRMSRAKLVAEAPGFVVRHQLFENWPEGVASHATAPMDYLIVALDRVVQMLWPHSGRLAVLRKSTLDIAGALVSPLLGLALVAFAFIWARGARGKTDQPPGAWWAVPLLVAVSPPLVHATVFARPDHQSLLCLLLALGLGSEQRIHSVSSRRWAWLGGLSWGLALWVSLYEPLVLLSAVLVFGILFCTRSWVNLIRVHWLGALLLPLGWGWSVDRIRIVMPDPVWADTLQRWGATIGELQRIGDWTVFSEWGGLLFWLVPAGVLLAVRTLGRQPLFWLSLLVLGTGLSLWQLRWSPYWVILCAFCLPWTLAVVDREWLRSAVVLLALWPVARSWDQQWNPEPGIVEQRSLDRSERINARLAAERMRSPETAPFLAVWWLSPSLAYWSGQPSVAGSAHEGISGIEDSARFFLSTTPAEARALLERRRVRVVVASDSARAVENSSMILGRAPSGRPLAEHLWQSERLSEYGLEGEKNVVSFRLLRVLETAPSP